MGYGLARRRRRAQQTIKQLATAREKRMADALGGRDGRVLAAALEDERPRGFASTRAVAKAPRPAPKVTAGDRASVSDDALRSRLSVPPPPTMRQRATKASKTLADMSGPRLLLRIFGMACLVHLSMSTYLHYTREVEDDHAYDEFGVHLSAHNRARARRERETEVAPTLLMVCGLEKSGATYVRQLLLDNLFIAPLDTHQNDHHNEPQNVQWREAADIRVDSTIPRNDPAFLLRATLKPGSAAAKTTLVVLVAKAPEAWVASSLLRPHPHYKPVQGRQLSEDDIDLMLERRAASHRDAFRLQRSLKMDGGGLDAVAYEEVLKDPEAFVDGIARAHGLDRRRGGHLLETHHVTSDAILNTLAEKRWVESEANATSTKRSHALADAGHGAARRARYAQSGNFQRKAWYLERAYLSDMPRSAVQLTRHHYDHEADALLGFSYERRASRRSARKQHRRRKHFRKVLKFVDYVLRRILFYSLLLLATVGGFVYYRLELNPAPAEEVETVRPVAPPPRPQPAKPPPTPEDLARMRCNEAELQAALDEARFHSRRPSTAAPPEPKASTAAPPERPASSYEAMWGNPKFSDSDDSSSDSSSDSEDDVPFDFSTDSDSDV